ncbi:CLAVATA3/ESR (CLE)-related protein 25-like [Cajanus cajan]|uniref:CLAVATA3/ESR (CLE)-related protein 25-like n=1 Tax=Cajanus cajan TaxID=3821 RepID=UPI0010FB8BAE|nr:CLAVATA3/ESR (CLE)-related protein 25-like [Cajanus cajan]
MGIISYSYFVPRFLLGALLVMGLVCLIVVGSIESGVRKGTTVSKHSAGNDLKQKHVIGSDKPNRAELDITFITKSRVPNGPDPIHNRRVRNSGRPPSQT